MILFNLMPKEIRVIKKHVPYEAYLFHDQKYNLIYEYQETEVVCLGACCFYHEEEAWVLDWVWMHPYFRHKGVFRNAWPEFIEKYGKFKISKPYSAEMERFLKKAGW